MINKSRISFQNQTFETRDHLEKHGFETFHLSLESGQNSPENHTYLQVQIEIYLLPFESALLSFHSMYHQSSFRHTLNIHRFNINIKIYFLSLFWNKNISNGLDLFLPNHTTRSDACRSKLLLSGFCRFKLFIEVNTIQRRSVTLK